MIDIGQERCMTLRELSSHLPVERSERSLRRYISDGVRSKVTNEIVKLDGIYVGGELYSSVEAFHRFIEESNGRECPPARTNGRVLQTI